MTSIIKKIEFTVSDSSDLVKNTIEYFKQSGFKPVDTTSDRKLKFKRGSLTSNMWTFNPLNWKSDIQIEISGEIVIANFNINTKGQTLTSKEVNLWEIFINNYQNYLTENTFDFKTENEKALNSTKKNSVKLFGWALLGGLIGGIPAGLIAHWTGVNWLAGLGVGIGATVFLMKKIGDDKRSNTV